MSLEPEHIKLLRDIHTAMVGNDLGTTGLINRMNTVEKKTSENKKQINNIKSTSVLYGTGAGTGVSAIILGVKAWWASTFGG
jgi:hypothetical protein